MVKAKALPRELIARSFTIDEARVLGVSPWRAKARDIHVPSRGIRVPRGLAQSVLSRAQPYTQLGTPDAVSWFSAAEIHGFKLPNTFELPELPAQTRLLHLTRNGATAPRRKGVAGHRAVSVPATPC